MKTLPQIAKIVEGEIVGEQNLKIKGVANLENAQKGDLAFLLDKKYLEIAKKSQASVIVTAESISLPSRTVLKTRNPRLALVKILELYAQNLVSKKKPKIGKRTRIFPQVYLGYGVEIGDDSLIYPGVVIYDGCKIGSRVIIHAGTVIGADGYGYVQQGSRWVKIPQIGNVIIEDEVEIKSNVCIDRATIGSTVIKNGTKIDNLTHIAHNCVIGGDCAITAGIMIAGSVEMGDRVQVGGQVGIRDHVSVGSDSIIIGKSGITKDIPPNSVISGFPAQDHQAELNQQAHIRKLPELFKRIAKLEDK